MPDWSRNVEQIMERIEERYQFIRNCNLMGDEDFEFINYHMDLAFEGRHDYLRR